MNTIDIILLILITAALVWAVTFCIRSRKNGKDCGGCCGDCSGCSKKYFHK